MQIQRALFVRVPVGQRPTCGVTDRPTYDASACARAGKADEEVLGDAKQSLKKVAHKVMSRVKYEREYQKRGKHRPFQNGRTDFLCVDKTPTIVSPRKRCGTQSHEENVNIERFAPQSHPPNLL